ncbi:hypothetical protein [Haliangium sp.]|uniref:hypothetical protein n=1 Tax=Haliangium sp. TaxID=2663208 RepID=UPI003D0BE1CC
MLSTSYLRRARACFAPSRPAQTLSLPVVATMAAVAVATLLSACVIAPEQGARVENDTVGLTVPMMGYSPTPGGTVTISVLDPANQDPASAAATWTVIGTATASTVAYDHNGQGPKLYGWTTVVTPVPNAQEQDRWQPSGMLRLRVADQSGILLPPMDSSACVLDHFNEPAGAILTACGSKDGAYLIMLDTDPVPTPQASFSGSGDHYLWKRETPNQGQSYYNTVGAGAGQARASFTGWANANHFANNDISAVFYNAPDLGLGRAMHCRRVTACESGEICDGFSGAVCDRVVRIACYVTNYGVLGDLTQAQFSLAQAIADVPNHQQTPPAPGATAIASVAMERVLYDPPSNAWCSGPAGVSYQGPNDVRFYVYDHTAPGDPIDTDVALDSDGQKDVPGLCLGCHGGSYDSNNHTVSGAQFLPFDVPAYEYSSSNSNYTEQAQQKPLHKLNTLVLETGPSPAIVDLVTGMYNGGNVASDLYVPNGWSGNADDTRLYREVVKPYCRMCHVARPGLDFSTASQFRSLSASVNYAVCQAHYMPHAEVTQKRFWDSRARAVLSHAFGLADCKL